MRWWRPLAARFFLAALTVLLGGFLAATLARYAPGYGTDERLLDARLSHQSVEAIRQRQRSREILCPAPPTRCASCCAWFWELPGRCTVRYVLCWRSAAW